MTSLAFILARFRSGPTGSGGASRRAGDGRHRHAAATAIAIFVIPMLFVDGGWRRGSAGSRARPPKPRPSRGAPDVKAALAILLAACSGACTVGPNFTRPVVVLPDTFRGASPPAEIATPATPFGDQAWWDVFQDDQLRALISAALTQNLDLQIAAARIVEAQAQLGITRADQFPTVEGVAGASRNRAARSSVPFPLDPYQRSDLRLTATVAWELDFWGKYRRATEAARAAMVGSEWGRRAVATSLVAEVAGVQLEMRTLTSSSTCGSSARLAARGPCVLTEIAASGGAVSLPRRAGSRAAGVHGRGDGGRPARQVAQQENYISVLLGLNPAAVGHGAAGDRHPASGRSRRPTVGAPGPATRHQPGGAAPDRRQRQRRVAKAAYFRN